MRAIIQRRYGPSECLSVEDRPDPRPGPGEVVVRVSAASVNRGDALLVRGRPFMVRLMRGLRRPRTPIPGIDLAGIVAEVGEGVQGLAPGDRVAADLSEHGFGAFAELVRLPASVLVAVPASLPLTEAAALPTAAVTALQASETARAFGKASVCS